MALIILQPGIEPVGQFDLEDSSADGLLGGEIGTVVSVPRANSATEKAAFDARDGYTNNSDQGRVAITTALDANGYRPLYLLDEGGSGYGIQLGNGIAGSTVGLGTMGLSGPRSSAGSGKVTVWAKPGHYGITLDAVDTHSTLGFLPSNTSLLPGAALYPMVGGRLTPTASRAAGGAVGADIVARFVEFKTAARSLVTTPVSLFTPGLATIAIIDFCVED